MTFCTGRRKTVEPSDGKVAAGFNGLSFLQRGHQQISISSMSFDIFVCVCRNPGLPDGTHIFIPKPSILVHFGKVWNILWLLGTFFCGHSLYFTAVLVNFAVVCNIFPVLYSEKSGNPGANYEPIAFELQGIKSRAFQDMSTRFALTRMWCMHTYVCM
jgi:hypothetical protein